MIVLLEFRIYCCYMFSHVNKKTTFTDPRLAFAVDSESYEGKMNMHTLKQKYDASSKPAQVLLGRDLSKKYVIVTGASSGIGKLRGWTKAA